jgi:hypothetical protein
MNGFCFDPTKSLNARAMSTARCASSSFIVSHFSDTSPFGFCSPPLNYFSFAGRNCGSKWLALDDSFPLLISPCPCFGCVKKSIAFACVILTWGRLICLDDYESLLYFVTFQVSKKSTSNSSNTLVLFIWHCFNFCFWNFFFYI